MKKDDYNVLPTFIAMLLQYSLLQQNVPEENIKKLKTLCSEFDKFKSIMSYIYLISNHLTCILGHVLIC